MSEAREVIAHTGDQFYAAEIHRLMGVLQSAQGDERHEEAEAALQQALAVARATSQITRTTRRHIPRTVVAIPDRNQDAYDLIAPV